MYSLDRCSDKPMSAVTKHMVNLVSIKNGLVLEFAAAALYLIRLIVFGDTSQAQSYGARAVHNPRKTS